MPEETIELGASSRRVGVLAAIALASACLMVLGLGAASAQAEIFYSSQTRIGRADLDGANKNPDLITGRTAVADIAVDENYVYWAEDTAAGGIYRANHDGTGVTTLVSGLNRPRGLAVDDQYLYYGTYNTITIGRANLDGTGNNPSFVTGVTMGASSIAVNDTHIFWSRWNTGGTNAGIGRANIDGTGVNLNFITTTPAVSPAWYVSTGGVDVNDTHIYWANWDGASGSSVGRAKLDGTEKQRNLITAINVPFGIAVDNSHVYWGVQYGNAYGRADLDGGNKIGSFITGVDNYPYGIAVLAEPRTTSTSVSCTPEIVALGTAATCTATVTDTGSGSSVTPSGTVSFTSDGSGAFVPIEGGCELAAGAETGTASCSVNYTPSAAGNETMTATYAGGADHDGSNGTAAVETQDPPHPVSVTVDCEPKNVAAGAVATCSATVSDSKATGQIPPAGQVSFSADGPGSFEPAATCDLAPTTDRASACQVGFKPSKAGVVLVTGAYAGSSGHQGGGDDVATLTVSEAPSTLPDDPGTEPEPPADGGEPTPPAAAPKFVLRKVAQRGKAAKSGRAVVRVTVPGAGRVILAGAGLRRVAKPAKAKGAVRLAVRAKGAKLRTLRKKGKVKVKARVTFRPAKGAARTRSIRLTLRLAR